MATTWILVADRSRARILVAEAESAPLQELEDFAHPEGHLREHEVVTDQQGQFAETGVAGSQTGDPEVDFKHQTAERFAHEIVQRLEKARLEGRFEKLVVIAAPLFLGVLRGQFPSPLRQLVSLELDKDYTQLGVDEIRSHLPETL